MQLTQAQIRRMIADREREIAQLRALLPPLTPFAAEVQAVTQQLISKYGPELSTKEAALEYGADESTLRDWHKKGLIKARRAGVKLLKFRASTIAHLIVAEHRQVAEIAETNDFA